MSEVESSSDKLYGVPRSLVKAFQFLNTERKLKKYNWKMAAGIPSNDWEVSIVQISLPKRELFNVGIRVVEKTNAEGKLTTRIVCYDEDQDVFQVIEIDKKRVFLSGQTSDGQWYIKIYHEDLPSVVTTIFLHYEQLLQFKERFSEAVWLPKIISVGPSADTCEVSPSVVPAVAMALSRTSDL